MTHYHGYAYTGPGNEIGSFDSRSRTPGGADFLTSRVPPFFTAHWLRKPKALVHGTWRDPHEAVAWLAATFLAAHTMPDRQPMPPVQTRNADAVTQLAMGNDLVWYSWTSSTSVASISVISCPNRAGTAPCPLGIKDEREPGQTTLTGVP